VLCKLRENKPDGFNTIGKSYYSAHSGEEGIYRVLVGKPEGKRPLGRASRKWEDIIKIDLQKVGIWTGSSWLRIGTAGGHL
jgi:hypothetical protein